MHKIRFYITLFVSLFLVFASPPSAQVKAADDNELLKSIAGKYEFYIDGRYQTLALDARQNNTLSGTGLVRTRSSYTLFDRDKLEFEGEINKQKAKLTFFKNTDGLIVKCILLVNNARFEGVRINKVEFRRTYTRDELQADFKQLRNIMETIHPALYEFTEKATFDSLFNQAYAAINDEMSLESFMKLIAPIVAKIGCGHSSLNPPTAYIQHIPGKFCPIQVRIIQGKAHLLRTFGKNSSIPVKSEIVAINGEAISDIIEKTLPYITADANLRSTKLYKLEGFFHSIYTLLYDFPDSYLVSFRPHGLDNVIETELEPVTMMETMQAGMAERQKMFDLDYEILADEDTAVMDINSFAFYSNRKKFFSFVDEAFKKLREQNVSNLILDLRRNEGGDPYCTAHLFSYLIHKPARYYRAATSDYKDLTELIQPADNRFNGKLYVLIDSGCFSSTNHLCALLKYHGIATFIGTETAGTYACNAWVRTIELKKTRFRVTLASKTATVDVKGLPRDRGIVPDHRIESTIGDMTGQSDAVKEFALQLIGGKK